MRVLVTGATGFVGREVVKRLREARHEVRIVVRNERAPAVAGLVSEFKVEVVRGDMLKPDSLRAVALGVEAAIHLVGIISECGKSTFENVHAGATRTLVAMAQLGQVKRFVQMSALGTRAGAVSRYHQTKWEAEEAVRNSGLDYTILRPSLIYGPEDHFVNLYAGMIRWLPVVPLLGGRQTLFQPVNVSQVAAAIVGSLGHSGALGQTFEICGPERMTLAEIIARILVAMDRRRMVLRIPDGLARFQAGLLEWVFPRLLRRPPPLNRDQLLMLQEDNIGDGKPADEIFGLKHPGFLQGITEYLGGNQTSMP
jgi:NADH dehydrogenase